LVWRAGMNFGFPLVKGAEKIFTEKKGGMAS